MNRDPDSINGYLSLIEKADARDKVLIGVTKEGDGLILAADHSEDGWCWCYPVVVALPCVAGHHPQHWMSNHRRDMDGELLEDDNPAGFGVTRSGTTFPLGQVCVGPGDRPDA